MDQSNIRYFVALLIGLGWTFMSFFLEPLLPLGSIGWLILTAVAWITAFSIAFLDHVKRYGGRLVNWFLSITKRKKPHASTPRVIDPNQLRIEIARLPMEEKEMLYSTIYSGGERGFKTDVLDQTWQSIEHLIELGFIRSSYQSIGPSSREWFVLIEPEAKPVVEEFFADRLRSGGEG